MRRKATLTWRSVKSGAFTDFVSDDGVWSISEGMDNWAAKRGQAFLLTHCATPAKGRPWKRVDAFKSVREAKAFAEEMSE